MLTSRWESFQMWPCQTESTQAALFYSTCCWLEVPWFEDHRQLERRQAKGGGHMGVHTTQTPSQHTPTHTSHKYWVYTMYSYLQVSSLNFKLVTVCKFSQPYFPILKLCFHTVQIFLRPSSFFFTFFISSVSLPTAPCFAQPHCCVFVCFLSSWHWTNLNF